ncbi:hypothetical protein [uncultured Ilyobacter sp.]|uniref:hypothetical protein n=1 Tax=uncultured Ilyobacter sp. TaxID=544433 RepID=UPI00374969ED
MKDAEVITTAIIARIYFNGNFQKTLTFFEDYPHFDYVLSKSRFSRRLAQLGSTSSKIRISLWNIIKIDLKPKNL